MEATIRNGVDKNLNIAFQSVTLGPVRQEIKFFSMIINTLRHYVVQFENAKVESGSLELCANTFELALLSLILVTII